MLNIGGQFRFSPSDLTNYLDSEYASWMDRWFAEKNAGNHSQDAPTGFTSITRRECRPDGKNEELELIAAKGIEHEERFLESLRDDGRNVIEIPSGELSQSKTIDALKTSAETIFQAHLVHGSFGGYADFLIKVPGESKLGDFHYEVWDTKLARSPKPYFVIQLCMYADLLEKIQGRRPAGFEVVLGTNERVRFQTDRFFSYYQSLKDSFLEFQRSFDLDSPPHPGMSRSHGRWSEFATEVLHAQDHLIQVAGITRLQIKKLEAADVSTVADLAGTELTRVPNIADETFQKLVRQAQLQVESLNRDRPVYEVVNHNTEVRRGLELLPPGSKSDVYFDMEGFPLHEGGLEYLFGAVYVEEGQTKFKDFWAHDKTQEKAAFEAFIDWVHNRWQADPTMHIYHYAPYEVTTIKRLMGAFATREEKVDDLLRNQVFVDLYKAVRQGLLIGAPSYSLKDVERLYMEKRVGEVTTSGGSIVAYHRWLESGEAEDWQNSPILKEIRDYNEVDCVSTMQLAEWLRSVQQESGIDFKSEIDPSSTETKSSDHPNGEAEALAQKILSKVEKSGQTGEEKRIAQLLSWLLEFHWREDRPVFWRMFTFHESTDAELVEDFDCLGGLSRTDKPKSPIKRSFLYEYKFNPDQETKLHEGSRCYFAHDLKIRTEVIHLDRENGLVEIKLGPSVPNPPETLSLIPDEYVSAQTIADAVFRYVESWKSGTVLSTAVDDLIHRRHPRITGIDGGPIVTDTDSLLESTVDITQKMQETVLCIQGPPGTGKTYTAAKAIVELLKNGKRVAITSNGHKAILNLMQSIHNEINESGTTAELVKVGGNKEDPVIESCGIVHEKESKKAVNYIEDGPVVIGGTAWVFSRPELEQEFDYLFIDEAGQFSLANVVGTGCCAKNIVLVGDQMQLAQPTLGSHPGESGLSALEYYLNGHQTIPPEYGVLLDESWRMYPDICGFVSDAVYESRLKPHPKTQNQRLLIDQLQTRLVTSEAGILYVPVEHEGNKQSSPEEAEIVSELFDELIGQSYIDFDGKKHESLGYDDILVVAPFNMQVRLLKSRLGENARVGTVDKFQGQEAPVVIFSMGASSIEESPRGAQFLLEPNRLNVAISRAKSLAIMVASPRIRTAKCTSIEEMELANLFCTLVERSANIDVHISLGRSNDNVPIVQN